MIGMEENSKNSMICEKFGSFRLALENCKDSLAKKSNSNIKTQMVNQQNIFKAALVSKKLLERKLLSHREMLLKYTTS